MPSRRFQLHCSSWCVWLSMSPYLPDHPFQLLDKQCDLGESIAGQLHHRRLMLVCLLLISWISIINRIEWIGIGIPLGANLTTFTACVCLDRVDRYSTFRSSPSASIFQSYILSAYFEDRRDSRRLLTRTLLSPPAVANLFPSGWKWAEYMGALSLCQLSIRGVLFMLPFARRRLAYAADDVFQ